MADQDTMKDNEIDILRIMEMLPHRYPFLLVDKVTDVDPGESAIGIKNVTMNEPHFMGHFPGQPVMPGVLIVEAMAQTAALVVMAGMDDADEEKIVYFMSINEARFRKPVVPGDRMELRVSKLQGRRNVWKFRGEAYVDDTLCAEAVYTAMIMNKADA